MTKEGAALKASMWWRHEFSLIRPKMAPFRETIHGLAPNPLPRPDGTELDQFAQTIFKYILNQLKNGSSKAFDNEYGWVHGLDVYAGDLPVDFELIDSLWKSINPNVRYETHGPLHAGTRLLCVNDVWKVKVKNGHGTDWSEIS